MRCRLMMLLLASCLVQFAAGQSSVATYVVPANGTTAQWALIGTFTASQVGHTVMITAYIHAGYNASASQDSTYVITFNTSNGSSVDPNGFAGDGSWYSVGYNAAIAPGNIKWVANAAGVSATAFSLYIYLPIWTGNSQYIVSVDPGASWTNVGTVGVSDPGVGSSSVMIPPTGFVLPYGNVGIGTTNPLYTLDIAGQLRTTSTAIFSNGNYGNTGPTVAVGDSGYGFSSYNGALYQWDDGPGFVLSHKLVFPDGSQQTTAWTGTVCGGDFAEAVEGAGDKKQYEPGDVLVLTSGDDDEVRKSTEPYSTMVAGIIATKPGVIGRRQMLSMSADALPMAMVGIVPTKVTAENGPIRKGDLLVTSSRKGYAMKGTDRSRMLGAVIGKAMGSLDSGTGMIAVLVTLQ